ncbi:methionyl-tRNA formyltransferase [Natranaerovirga pectinivora]|uniref:Methionyl-tRNA formyltransferase n=1 Tax=Natranaerovirga pectinivora TaxID=682400 RepID=A0A4R3MQZ4_9FIRM|nr:methionyl-tRNA formyltransferase [Natranaerovirga pectinivora]TCT16943.1 methionyl-tRNA formyltransferase [Natranaerovirga pectinivora]
MKVIFMGTPDFSVPTLEALIESSHEVIGVITQPDKPKGRGKKMVVPPVKEMAIKHGIPVYQPLKVRDKTFIEFVRSLNPDVAVVIAFGQILSLELLEVPKFGCINVHASLLPKYRGAGPIQWSVINGESETGITTMHMDVGIDTGDMIFKDIVKIEAKETGGSLHDKLSTLGANTLLKTLEALENGSAPRERQVDEESTYAPMLSKELGLIDWSKDAVEIERLIRGLNPWPSAYSYLDGKMVKIWDGDVISSNNKSIGEVIHIDKSSIIVQTGKDALAIKELQLEGKKRMTTEEFLRGYKVDLGVKLG